ncbi:hypothetical protein C8Q77DRAFT_1152413 [Trametes polyzona]|nr:hypothetical protein C8Q77DRAFT_1152413 [Trametes polyzona]
MDGGTDFAAPTSDAVVHVENILPPAILNDSEHSEECSITHSGHDVRPADASPSLSLSHATPDVITIQQINLHPSLTMALSAVVDAPYDDTSSNESDDADDFVARGPQDNAISATKKAVRTIVKPPPSEQGSEPADGAAVATLGEDVSANAQSSPSASGPSANQASSSRSEATADDGQA